MPGLCRECRERVEARAEWCQACGASRLLWHEELFSLSLAHIDCDAFYASVEKRDRPELIDRPLIVGRGHRGVVTTACYIARRFGVRSAMPMHEALKRCPKAVVVPPDMAKYSKASAAIRRLMLERTPLVEPLSLDEAYLDLSGTEELHNSPPASVLVDLARRIEREVGVTVSVGLSYNKFLAKLASDLDKPRGFAVIGRAEAMDFLAPKPIRALHGVGPALADKLAVEGIVAIGQLQEMEEEALVSRLGKLGGWLWRRARGEDHSPVEPNQAAKSISAETTLERNLSQFEDLAKILWPLCETVSRRLKAAELAGRTLTLKLKTSGFRSLTRSRQLADSTQLAETIYRNALSLLEKEANGRDYRLIGVGLADFTSPEQADPPDLVDKGAAKLAAAERAMDSIRGKFGPAVIGKGRGLRA
jgi:DNA polymerase-4